ncbi:platelet-derived growth factor subunit B-like isoform X1 [Acipenser oxyrinchus oxyrinchus]|uniref:Platelet-derived growth factor subunit B n=1 Tax=Acipenser oxyrinchus oxyrinchus TaxID=40147 RepID=A0AAD8FS07_ACIOX|nr:platelet-derived growth factor subunit B-like isoform X1 [Acipenser oxyrinchus oxyrinchus]
MYSQPCELKSRRHDAFASIARVFHLLPDVCWLTGGQDSRGDSSETPKQRDPFHPGSAASLADRLQEDSLPDQAVSFRRQLRSNSSLSRVVRSLQGLAVEADMAVPAQCQPRTEVLELTRGMVDRSNTNFLVWPLCVEVQRCSGCCNTHSMHCRPTRVQPRQLQVVKIEYVQKKARHGKALVTVEDHLECRCEASPPPAQHSKHKPAVTPVAATAPLESRSPIEAAAQEETPQVKTHLPEGSTERAAPQIEEPGLLAP